MSRISGEANIRGKIAYVPQQAWMQNETLKNNILFGREHKKDLYEKVTRAQFIQESILRVTFFVKTQIQTIEFGYNYAIRI